MVMKKRQLLGIRYSEYIEAFLENDLNLAIMKVEAMMRLLGTYKNRNSYIRIGYIKRKNNYKRFFEKYGIDLDYLPSKITTVNGTGGDILISAEGVFVLLYRERRKKLYNIGIDVFKKLCENHEVEVYL
jgi:hypothetical protein